MKFKYKLLLLSLNNNRGQPKMNEINKERCKFTLTSIVAVGLLSGICTLTSTPTTLLSGNTAEPVRYHLDRDEDRTRVYVGYNFFLGHQLFVDEGNDGTLDRVKVMVAARSMAGYHDFAVTPQHQQLYEKIRAHSNGIK